MTICLYGSPISTFARKVAIGLELKGLPYDLVDALKRGPDVPSKPNLADAQRAEELLAQDLSGMGGDTVLGDHGDLLLSCLVVVDQSDLFRAVGCPAEDKPPLAGHPGAVETLPVFEIRRCRRE